MTVINNWRASHAFPLNTFQVYLRRKSREVDSKSLVAQRVKRLSSIESKLRRFGWLKLSQMQDIGGCRAVVRNVNAVHRVVDLYRDSEIKHRLVNEDDYIADPKASGYRGHHLIYRYYSDKKDTYNGLKVEVQIRTSLQHSWATAVETVGTFTHQALKSSDGEGDWLRFFALMGNEMALRERAPLVPGTPTDHKELVEEIRDCAVQLDVETRLQSYSRALRTVDHPIMQGSRYFLLVADPQPESTNLSVRGYKRAELDLASEDYLRAEREVEKSGGDAVLVSVDSLSALRTAYPNYFLDTRRFLTELRRILRPPRKPGRTQRSSVPLEQLHLPNMPNP